MRKHGLRFLLLVLLLSGVLMLIPLARGQEATATASDDTALESASAEASTEEAAPAESGEGVEVASAEGESAGAQAPGGIGTLVLLAGVGAVLLVGLLVLARDNFRNKNTDSNNG